MPNCFALPSVEKAPAWLDSPFLRGLLLLVNNEQDNKKIGKQTTNPHKMDHPFFRRFADIFWTRLADKSRGNLCKSRCQVTLVMKAHF